MVMTFRKMQEYYLLNNYSTNNRNEIKMPIFFVECLRHILCHVYVILSLVTQIILSQI